VPCDPVVTVAPDVVFFECFAKDESSYGCLSVSREAFKNPSDAGMGTTNVDYSMALYEHFQTLRSYRPTRLQVDPTGFSVKVESQEDYREEKIDLPPSWLKGFGQLQAAMGLPARVVELSTESVYSILAYLRRHREKTGPRSIRFSLFPGRPPTITLDPWGVQIISRGKVYNGEQPEEIKIWGRRRLMTLARVLPLAESFEVRLLGTGLPSIWVAYMGEMRFQLALSGWTTNDWTSGANLDLLAGNFNSDPNLTALLDGHLSNVKLASLHDLVQFSGRPKDAVLSALFALAKQGQSIFDFAVGVYRHRPVMPVALSEQVVGPDSPELVAGRDLRNRKRIHITRHEGLAKNKQLMTGKVDGTAVEVIFDADGMLGRAKCTCSYFFKNRLRQGPCRHLIAVQLHFKAKQQQSTYASPILENVAPTQAPAPSMNITMAPSSTTLAPAPQQPNVVQAKPSATNPPKSIAELLKVVPYPPRGTTGDSENRRKQVFMVSEQVLEDWEEKATELDRSVAWLLEACWELAKDQVAAAQTLDALRTKALGSTTAKSSERAKKAVNLPNHTLDHMDEQAERLGTSVSVLAEMMWALVKGLLPKSAQ
jgi:hypothetical protein